MHLKVGFEQKPHSTIEFYQEIDLAGLVTRKPDKEHDTQNRPSGKNPYNSLQ